MLLLEDKEVRTTLLTHLSQPPFFSRPKDWNTNPNTVHLVTVLVTIAWEVCSIHWADESTVSRPTSGDHPSSFGSFLIIVFSLGIPTPSEWQKKEIFNEIVIDGETQIAPVYILEIDKSNFGEIAKDWEITENSQNRAGGDRDTRMPGTRN